MVSRIASDWFLLCFFPWYYCIFILPNDDLVIPTAREDLRGWLQDRPGCWDTSLGREINCAPEGLGCPTVCTQLSTHPTNFTTSPTVGSHAHKQKGEVLWWKDRSECSLSAAEDGLVCSFLNLCACLGLTRHAPDHCHFHSGWNNHTVHAGQVTFVHNTS